MPKFTYRAMSSAGEIMENDSYESDSIEAVHSMLSSNKLMPLEVKELNQSKEIDLSIGSGVSLRDIAIFCRQFSTMLEAGVTINAAINMLSEQIPSKKLRIILKELEDDIKKGESLSASMYKHPKIFPELLVRMVEVGEMSGTLDTMMNRMAVYYEKQHKLNGKVKNAMIYPTVLAIVTVVVMIIILVFVMPMFVSMFDDFGGELPWTTKLTLAMSNWLRNNILLAGGLTAAMGGVFWYLTTKVETTERYYNIFKLRYSPFRDINQKAVVSKFARSLATVLTSGVPIVDGLDIVGGVLGNRFAENEMKSVKDKILKGEGLAEPIKETGVFPLMMSSMIKIGEESGSLDTILNKTADFYEEELERAIEAITSIIEPMMIVIMGVICGFLIISILTPMFEMYNLMM
ncbi:MAG: type II secretion system F family protein [Sarcina sp.]